MIYREAARKLAALGCQEVPRRGGGAHRKWTNPGTKRGKGDIHQFCPTATFGSVGDCMRPHLSEASGTCKAAMAFMASPAADRY